MNNQQLSQSLAKEMQAVRQKKIALLRKRIAEGTYVVRKELLAQALAPPRYH